MPSAETDLSRGIALECGPARQRGGLLRLLLRGVLLLLLLAVLVFFVHGYYCERWVAPDRQAEISLRERFVAAVGQGAARLLPRLTAEFKAGFARYDAEMQEQEDRFWPFTDYRSAVSSLRALRVSLPALEAELQKAREQVEQRAGENIRQLAAAIVEVKAAMARGIAEAGIRRQVAVAEIRLAEAEAYFKGKDFEKVLQRSGEGLAAVSAASLACRDILSHFTVQENVSLWKEWIQEAVALSRKRGTALVIVKSRHRLDYYRNGVRTRSFPVEIGKQPIAQKRHEGDQATPEGLYRVTEKLGPKRTVYFLALRIDYPNAEDRQRFDRLRRQGDLPAGARIGGNIEIHGKGGRGFDWTLGCAALTNEDMRWLYDHVPAGCPVAIVGNDGNDAPPAPAPAE